MSQTSARKHPVGYTNMCQGIALLVVGLLVAFIGGAPGAFFLFAVLGVVFLVVGYLRRLLAAVENR